MQLAVTTVMLDWTQTYPDDQKMKDGRRAFEEATGITINMLPKDLPVGDHLVEAWLGK